MPGRAGFGWRLLERGGVLCRCEACGLNRLIEVDERSISIHIWLKEKKLCVSVYLWVGDSQARHRRNVPVPREREFGRAGARERFGVDERGRNGSGQTIDCKEFTPFDWNAR